MMGKFKARYFLPMLCLILASAALGQTGNPALTASPETIFSDRGLSRSGVFLILPEEAEVHDGVWAIRQSDEGLRVEATGRRNLAFELQNGNHDLDSLENEYAVAVDRYNQITAAGKNLDHNNTDVYNQWVNDQNAQMHECDLIFDKIDKQKRAMDDMVAREATVEDSRARHIGLVMDVGTKAESIVATYAKLTRDAELTRAIQQVDQTEQPPLRLGPSGEFLADLKFVRQCAKEIVTGSVPVQRTNIIGGLHVEAVLNGKLTDTMIWDSGADVVVLSAATGNALGLKPTDKDETVVSRVADGREVKSKQIFLDSIRVGAFTLHNVVCFLMLDSPDAPPSDDLLGDSFQSHFLSRLDQRTNQLQLTPIDSSVIAGPVAEPLPKHAASPNDINPDLARGATATASSTYDGYNPSGAIDGVIGGYPKSPQNEWACGQRTGSITLTWSNQLIISSVKLWDRVNGNDHITSGQLVFDDGSTVPFGELPTDRTPLSVPFRPKYVHWMRVEILTVSDGTSYPGFAEIAAFR
jgi:Aspartyl protease